VQPNILLICADQWRFDCISALGHKNVKTPNIDALMGDAVTFTSHFTQCTPCGPSRTSLLTGMYLMNHRSGRNGTPFSARHTNLALEARKLGYEPVLFGYTDTTPDPTCLHPNDPALTAYDEGIMPGFKPALHLPEDMEAWVAHLISLGYDLPKGRGEVFALKAGFEKPVDRGFRSIPARYKAEHSETAFLIDQFINWLRVPESKPWFAHLVFLRPHPPLIAPEPYNMSVHPRDVSVPHRAKSATVEGDQHPFLRHQLATSRKPNIYDEHNPIDLIDADELEIRQLRATYFGLVEEMDHHLGRVIDQLKKSGQYDNTLIILTSDHGEVLGDHYYWGKEIYFDASFRIPLIIRDPSAATAAARGNRVTEFTEAIDVMPTILSRLGAPLPRNCDGRSLMHFLHGEHLASWRDCAFFEHDFRSVRTLETEVALDIPSDACSYAVIRDRKFKYIHFAALPPLFFDIEHDPHEFKNLADDPKCRLTMLSYAQRLLSWRLLHQERQFTNMHVGEGGLVSRP
jgi:arylsulfatase A-like enzyme